MAEIDDTDIVLHVGFSADNRLLASTTFDGRLVVRSIGTWQKLADIDIDVVGSGLKRQNDLAAALAFHPTLRLLASVAPGGSLALYQFDADVAPLRDRSQRYAVAKVVLVGESGVGKTGLGHRLATDTFTEHPSTHGQQFWPAETLAVTRDDGTRCEVALWDLAGQPDYRLIHVLFLDDADAALIVFDAARRHESLEAVAFWTKAVTAARPGCQTDRCCHVHAHGRPDRAPPPAGTRPYGSTDSGVSLLEPDVTEVLDVCLNKMLSRSTV